MADRRIPLAALLAFVATGLATGCPPVDEGSGVSPYPALTVTGTVLDVRGDAPIVGAQVLVWNEFDSKSEYTGADGSFSIVVDGSDSASYLRVTDPGYRPYQTSVTVKPTSLDVGTHRAMSKDEVLFSTSTGDIHMIRVGGDTSLVTLAATADVESSPCRSESGLTVRWLDQTTKEVVEGAWDGAGANAVWTEPDANPVLDVAWAPRATFVAINDGTDDRVVMAGEPSGVGYDFSYDWKGYHPAASPAAFGYFGGLSIQGNMLAFATGAGISTAFPYFASSFLVPEAISTTQAGDDFPAWSPFRADGTLDLAFRRTATDDVYVTRVSASGQDNVWSSAMPVYGTGANDAHITDVAWAPETAGQDDRLVLVVNPFFGGGASTFDDGDLIVLSWNHVSKTVTAGPTLLYDASAIGGGLAQRVTWR
jgi:hypothetical protein